MVRRAFYLLSVLSLILVALIYPHKPHAIYALYVIFPLIFIGVYDVFSHRNVLRNYPVLGHLRYLSEFIRPEIQQYFVAGNLSGRPYDREVRDLVYRRAINADAAHPFGTEHDIMDFGYEFAMHSLAVKKVNPEKARIIFGGKQCKKPYSASRINVSAMSYGALGAHAVRALNRGAKLGNFAHNTGEGGLTNHHLREGGDIIMQLGTAYFGCRQANGRFSEEEFVKKIQYPQVKMVEIKLSQGAKPSHGGLLPKEKITEEIAHIRGIEMGKDCLSPPTHAEFSTPRGLLEFLQKLRDLSGGLPIGFKICVGIKSEFMSICKAMLETGILPDFITVDGAEGGTGAAPLEYTNRFGMPINEGLAFVHNCLVGINLRDQIRIISSGKVASGFDVVMKLALGADTCNIARAMLFSIGCIQALRCHTNRCPTGVTTLDPKRNRALVIKDKAVHVVNYHRATIESFLDMCGAMGCDDPDKLTPEMILLRWDEADARSYRDIFHYVAAGNFLSDEVHGWYSSDWALASADSF